MGQVVRLKLPETTVTESTFDRTMRTVARQKKTIAKLKEDLEQSRSCNDVLIRLLNEPLDEIRRLRRNLMRLQDEVLLREHCTCTPERSDFLRRR